MLIASATYKLLLFVLVLWKAGALSGSLAPKHHFYDLVEKQVARVEY